MSKKPIPGSIYTTEDGDNLSLIAQRTWGIKSKWKDIHAVNPQIKNPNVIRPGYEITIPGSDQKIELPQITNKKTESFTLISGGNEIPVMAGKVIRTMDTFADAWSATLANTASLRSKINLFDTAEIYLGNDKILTGKLYERESEVTSTESKLNIGGWSHTADLIDSTVSPPFQYNRTTLKNLAEKLIKPTGIKVIWESSNTTKFRRVKIGKTEKIFSALNKLALQVGVVLSSDRDGNALFVDPASTGTVGTLKEGTSTLPSFKIKQDGRKQFSKYKVYGTGPRKRISAISIDKNVPVSRMTTQTANDIENKDIQGAADYRRNLAVANMLTFDLPVVGWAAPNGKLWEENTLVTVDSPSLFLPEGGFTFLIKQVGFDWSVSGVTATLSLVPPTVYTKEELIYPW